jgi:hypothetical protein
MLNHRDIVTLHVRRIVAEVYGWSVAGSHEAKELPRFVNRAILTQRLREELGVDISENAWADLSDVGRLVRLVHLVIRNQYV